MKLAHCNAMSVGIFAWSRLEPAEGQFDFAWLDRVMDMIAEAGGAVVLATPSGARPHWLADKYPEVLRVRPDRQRNLFGGRHNHCLTSPIYREKVRLVNRKLAERYQSHPALEPSFNLLLALHIWLHRGCFSRNCAGCPRFNPWRRLDYGRGLRVRQGRGRRGGSLHSLRTFCWEGGCPCPPPAKQDYPDHQQGNAEEESAK